MQGEWINTIKPLTAGNFRTNASAGDLVIIYAVASSPAPEPLEIDGFASITQSVLIRASGQYIRTGIFSRIATSEDFSRVFTYPYPGYPAGVRGDVFRFPGNYGFALVGLDNKNALESDPQTLTSVLGGGSGQEGVVYAGGSLHTYNALLSADFDDEFERKGYGSNSGVYGGFKMFEGVYNESVNTVANSPPTHPTVLNVASVAIEAIMVEPPPPVVFTPKYPPNRVTLNNYGFSFNFLKRK